MKAKAERDAFNTLKREAVAAHKEKLAVSGYRTQTLRIHMIEIMSSSGSVPSA